MKQWVCFRKTWDTMTLVKIIIKRNDGENCTIQCAFLWRRQNFIQICYNERGEKSFCLDVSTIFHEREELFLIYEDCCSRFFTYNFNEHCHNLFSLAWCAMQIAYSRIVCIFTYSRVVLILKFKIFYHHILQNSSIPP